MTDGNDYNDKAQTLIAAKPSPRSVVEDVLPLKIHDQTVTVLLTRIEEAERLLKGILEAEDSGVDKTKLFSNVESWLTEVQGERMIGRALGNRSSG